MNGKTKENFKEILLNSKTKQLAQRSLEKWSIMVYNEIGNYIGKMDQDLGILKENKDNKRRKIVW